LAGGVIIERGLEGEVEPHRLPGVTQFPDAYKAHALVRILVAQGQTFLILPGIFGFRDSGNSPANAVP
jgi:hypothetical protein